MRRKRTLRQLCCCDAATNGDGPAASARRKRSSVFKLGGEVRGGRDDHAIMALNDLRLVTAVRVICAFDDSSPMRAARQTQRGSADRSEALTLPNRNSDET
jgi:hypothetical protein